MGLRTVRKGAQGMNKTMEETNRRMERRYLERKALHLRRELQDWPMTPERREAKLAELQAIRTELLGSL